MVTTPKYISSNPQGIDKFDSESQKLLSEAIVNHIIRNDAEEQNAAISRIIGIEGTWGSGKSNVVKMVEKKFNQEKPYTYFFFEYDAWGNQEDLQRRSLLEQLTSRLVEANVLKGKTKIVVKGGDTKTVSWPEKLKILLARKTETSSETYPRISNGMIAGVLTTILTFISTLAGFLLNCGWISFGIGLLPIGVSLFVWSIAACMNKNYRNPSYFLAVYNDKIDKETQFEVISEDEPSVWEFKNWMQDVSDNLNSKVCQKLVIVFDNMDRLPSDKVKQLWSSIHTFFAETGFGNIWVIIPYDESHLQCAFGEKNSDERKKLTRYFINKTFPVTFTVPKPVITDYKGIFSKLFSEAFGDNNPEEDFINRIYRLNRPEPNIREIIIFINNLVSLNLVWNNQIKLTNMAIYILHKDDIQSDPIKSILSGNYLKQEKSIIEDNEDYKNEIAALTYGINKEIAKQIPLTDYINRCIDLVEGYDINLYSETNPNFDSILKDSVSNTDTAKNVSLIKCLNGLKKSNNTIRQIWDEIAIRLLKTVVKEQNLPDEYKLAIPHLSKNYCQKIIDKLCLSWRSCANFNGADYVRCLNTLDLIQGVEIEIPCPTLEVSPNAYIDAVSIAINSYQSYNLVANPLLVDKYIAEKIPNDMKFADVVCKLYEDGFCKFENTKAKIGDVIKGNAIDANNVWPICKIYRCINENVVSELIDENVLASLLPELSNNDKKTLEDGYIDLLAISIAKQRAIVIEDKFVNEVASIIDSYIDYGKLMQNGLNKNNVSVDKVVKYMIEHNLGKTLNINSIMPLFMSVKDHYSVKGTVLLSNLNKWAIDYNVDTSEDSINTLLPSAEIFKITTTIDNALAKKINKFGYDSLSQRTCQQFIDTERNYSSDYWHIALNALVNDDSFQDKPQCIKEYASYIYKQLATGIRPIKKNDYFYTIAQSVRPVQISHIFAEIRNSFCNGEYQINSDIFVFCENNLVVYGQLQDRATDVVNTILKPIIGSQNVKDLILAHKDVYSQLFKKASSIDDFKAQVKRYWSDDSSMLDLLGIKIDKE